MFAVQVSKFTGARHRGTQGGTVPVPGMPGHGSMAHTGTTRPFPPPSPITHGTATSTTQAVPSYRSAFRRPRPTLPTPPTLDPPTAPTAHLPAGAHAPTCHQLICKPLAAALFPASAARGHNKPCPAPSPSPPSPVPCAACPWTPPWLPLRHGSRYVWAEHVHAHSRATINTCFLRFPKFAQLRLVILPRNLVLQHASQLLHRILLH